MWGTPETDSGYVVTERIDGLRTALGVTRASLWTTDTARFSSLRLAVGHADSEPSPLGLVLPPRAGLVGAVTQSKSPLAVENAALAREHLDVSSTTGFAVGGVLSLPIILKGEAWGVLQLVEPTPRSWKRGEITRAQNHVDQLRISLLEQFIATGSSFPEGLLATILTTGSGRS
jgi:GAF domain-containing protein